MALRKYIVFDFETDSKYPETTNPVQLAAVAIDERRLELIPNSEFNIVIRPPDIDEPDYIEKHIDTIQWHANLRKTTVENIVEGWKNGINEKHAWNSFKQYVDQYNWQGKMFTAPIACGANIERFDLVIAKRLNEKYKLNNFFWPRNIIDVQTLTFFWLNDVKDAPQSHAMDSLRDYFGMSKENAHDALQDVKDSARMIIKFLKLHRYLAPKIKFKDALREG